MSNFMGLVRSATKAMTRPLMRNGDSQRKAYYAGVTSMPLKQQADWSRYRAAIDAKRPVESLGLNEADLRQFGLLDKTMDTAKQLDHARTGARIVTGMGAGGLALGVASGIHDRQKELEMRDKEAAKADGVKELLLGGMDVAEPLIAGSVGSLLGAGAGLTAAHLTSPVGLSKEVIRKEELAREYQTGINRIRERMALNAFRAQWAPGSLKKDWGQHECKRGRRQQDVWPGAE